METDAHATSHQASSQTPDLGLTSVTTPTCDQLTEGQSVENIPTSNLTTRRHDNTPHWFVIRATRGRAQQVHDQILQLSDFDFQVYVPRYRRESLKIVDGQPVKVVTECMVHNGLVFLRTTRTEFYKLVHAEPPYPLIPGLTPYYDHFHYREAGRNEYLIVPDQQFSDFRTILESQDVNILVDPEAMPAYLNGKRVEVISGPFTGITGTLLRWKGLRRVFIQLDQIGTFATSFIRNCDFRIIE